MIIVDSRELRSQVPKILEKLKIPYQVSELEVGDYIVGNVAVERKEINDYLSSLTSGHLATQLYELSYNFELSYVVIIGYISEALFYRKMAREPIISSFVGSSLKRAPDGKQGQIITVNLENNYDFAYFLRHLEAKLNNYEPRLPPIVQKAKYSPDEQLIYVLCSIPGIGYIKAKQLLQKFGTLKNIVNASKQQLLQVPGIGDKIASTILEIFEKKYVGEDKNESCREISS